MYPLGGSKSAAIVCAILGLKIFGDFQLYPVVEKLVDFGRPAACNSGLGSSRAAAGATTASGPIFYDASAILDCASRAELA